MSIFQNVFAFMSPLSEQTHAGRCELTKLINKE